MLSPLSTKLSTVLIFIGVFTLSGTAYADNQVVSQTTATSSIDQTYLVTYPMQSFTAPASFTIGSIAAGDDGCGISISNGTSILGTYGTVVSTPGGWRDTGGSVAVTSGSVYYLVSGCNGSVGNFSGTQVETLYTGGTAGRGIITGASFVTNASVGNSLADWAFTICSDTTCTLSPQTQTTRFISVTPTNGATVATTTSVGAEIYISSSDYVSGTYLEISLQNQALSVAPAGASALDAFNAATGQGTQYPLVQGYNNISTTTVFNYPGVVFAQYHVRTPTSLSTIPLVGLYFTPSSLLATTTSFTVSTTTVIDLLIAGHNFTPHCEIAQFSAWQCASELVFPGDAELNDMFKKYGETVSSRAPFAYIPMFWHDLQLGFATTSAASTVLPGVKFNIADSGICTSGACANTVIDLTPWDRLLGPTSVLGTATSSKSGLTLRQIIEPNWDLFIYLLFIIMFFWEVVGLGGKTVSAMNNL